MKINFDVKSEKESVANSLLGVKHDNYYDTGF